MLFNLSCIYISGLTLSNESFGNFQQENIAVNNHVFTYFFTTKFSTSFRVVFDDNILSEFFHGFRQIFLKKFRRIVSNRNFFSFFLTTFLQNIIFLEFCRKYVGNLSELFRLSILWEMAMFSCSKHYRQVNQSGKYKQQHQIHKVVVNLIIL